MMLVSNLFITKSIDKRRENIANDQISSITQKVHIVAHFF